MKGLNSNMTNTNQPQMGIGDDLIEAVYGGLRWLLRKPPRTRPLSSPKPQRITDQELEQATSGRVRGWMQQHGGIAPWNRP